MNGTVTKLCDIAAIEIPAELTALHVDEAQLDADVARLSLRYAKEEPAARVNVDDVVRASADCYADGRTVLLYPGVSMPGAEAAELAVIGAAAGDTVETELCGRPAKLTIQSITRRFPVPVTDALIASLGIEGVKTVADYRAQLREKALSDAKMEQHKAIIRYFLDEIEAGSEFSYDEAEMDAFVKKSIAEAAAYGALDAGMDEAMLRDSVIGQQKQSWAAEELCRRRGIMPDEAAIEAEADQMLEMMQMMGEPSPSREEMLEASRQNAAMTAFFACLDEIIAEKLGG